MVVVVVSTILVGVVVVVVVVVVGDGGEGQRGRHWAVVVVSVSDWWGNWVPDVDDGEAVVIVGGGEG